MVLPILVPVPPLLMSPGPLTSPSPSPIFGWDRFPHSEEGLRANEEKPFHLAERVAFLLVGP